MKRLNSPLIAHQLQTILQANRIPFQGNKHIKQFKQLFYMRRLTEFIMISLLQYVGLMLGNVPDEPIPIWPASGVAVAMLFFRGNRIWPGLWAGGILAYWFEGASLQTTLSVSLLHVMEAISIRFATHRIIGPLLPLNRATHVLEFFFIAFGITFLSSGIITGLTSPDKFWAEPIRMQWFINWLADFGGVIIFAPACLIWDVYLPDFKQPFSSKLRKTQAYCLTAAIIIVNSTLMLLTPFEITFPLSMATLPLILMAAFYFGQCGATLSAVFTTMIGICNFQTHNQVFQADSAHIYFLSLQCKYCLESGLAFYLATHKLEHKTRFSRFG